VDEVAWYADNSGRQRWDSERIWKKGDQADFLKRLTENGNGMHEVGQKRANGLGLCDMLGNVGEWVNDWWDQSYYRKIPPQDPSGPTRGQLRVLRGGSWKDIPSNVRISDRGGYNPVVRRNYVGFRCVGEGFVP
jgi:formylglycine-generating enzyme required for sulfatase activity